MQAVFMKYLRINAMINRNRTTFWIGTMLLVVGMTGCAITPKVLHPSDEGHRKLVIFFDGTANDESSDTNIKKLHSLVTLQQKRNISTFYVEGVGANGKAVGMATGWGVGRRVRLAYQYLAQNYRNEDEIYIFGFSRGAYSARILASMLYYAGLPSQPLPARIINDDFADLVYDAFKGEKSSADRQFDVRKTVTDNNLPPLKTVTVAFMGIWDTVEALGWPNYKENIDVPNKWYGDQLCNVKEAAHAMSIDDDRARIFTPILLTRPHLLQDCITESGNKPDEAWVRTNLDGRVDEVWFSGAHADIGGGYVNGLLSGVSLNWMISKLKDSGLLPVGAAVAENRYEKAHDPESGLPWSILYHQMSRHLNKYAFTSVYNNKKLKVHQSVIDRLSQQKPASHEFQWIANAEFPQCFEETAVGYRFVPTTECMLQVVH